MGCDIHLYVEQRQGDGSWKAVEGPNPRIATFRDWSARDRERGKFDDADELEARASAIESGAKATYEPDEDGYVSEYNNPKVFCDWVWDGRNYDLFAILADVRNGRGFAGVETGLGFNPISRPKGLPQDVTQYIKARSDNWGCDGHSHSHHTVADLLNYDWHQITFRYGIVNESGYRTFKEQGSPDTWCGGVSGSGVVHVEPDEMDSIIAGSVTRRTAVEYFTRVKWMVSYKDAVGSFYTDAIPKLQELAGEDPSSVRIVFWFDN